VAVRKNRYQQLTRDELIAALRGRDARERVDRRAMHEVLVHQEQLAAQQEQLLEAQRALELSRDQFAELFDFCPLPYVVLDANGVVHRMNVAASALLDARRTRVERVPFLVHVTKDDRRAFLDHMRRCRHEHELTSTELVLKTQAGEDVPVQLTSRPSLTSVGEHHLYHTTATDLRERRQLEGERLKAAAERHRMLAEQQTIFEANAAKDRFLAVLSHELRTPLTPILLATSTWKDDRTLSEPMRKTLAMISRNIGVQARLIDDLLDMTRITQKKIVLQRESVDLHVVVEEVFDQARTEMAAASLAGSLVLRAAHRHVSGDPLRLRQIVWNLVKNSIRFTPAGGRITLATDDPHPGRVELRVVDTGAGFSEDSVDKMFEPFSQGPRSAFHGGLGLGLAITKGLVDAHGATITATSDGPQRGACFTVEFATAEAPMLLPAPPPVVVHADGNGTAAQLRILLVEDHEDTAQALAYVLEHQGYSVSLAHSVAQAIATTETREIDVVVSDLGLPDGSGLDLMRYLKQRRKTARGIALTGYGRREDLDETTRAGFQRHLTKPVDVPTLIAAIESLRSHAA
jgi:PAS domain S-box-containing protein